MITQLVICSKSTWQPPIRREHALAELAADDGLSVTFVERPRDLRAIAGAKTASVWWSTLTGGAVPVQPRASLTVRARAGLVPAHRSRLAQQIDTPLLSRELRRASIGSETSLLATAPWHWDAVARAPAARRIFDCADDWAALMPCRRNDFHRAYARVAEEADGITVASQGLRSLFPARKVAVIRNGVSPEMLRDPVRPATDGERMLYAGTLSHRFDTGLVTQVLTALPDWRLDLYGQCQYPHRGEQPAHELDALLSAFRGQAIWHGVIRRERLAREIDSSRVCLLPHRHVVQAAADEWGPANSEFVTPSYRGDAMKLYDYAARGRPIVSTNWQDDLRAIGPPHLYLAQTPSEFCDAVSAAIEEPSRYAHERRAWAEEQRWERRWQLWRAIIRGA